MRNITLRKRLFAFLTGALLAFASAPALSQADFEPGEADRENICKQATAKPFQQPSFPNPMTEAQLKSCDSMALYYGFDNSPNYEAALQCGYYQRAHPDPTIGDPFRGPGVLTMLYANGKGVKRNYDLAIRFACENTWAAEAEISLRVGHLQHLRDTHGAASKFDLCDDATSGLMQGACERVVQGFADAKRDKELAAITAQWPAQFQEAFKLLQIAEDDFEDARTGNEVDLSGTRRVAFELAERGRLRDQFLINLNRFAKGDIPQVSAPETSAIDQRLNTVYQQLQNVPADRWEYGTIKPKGIRETERAWIKLRDAWATFAHLAYPDLDSNRIVAQITRLRIHQLQSLVPPQ